MTRRLLTEIMMVQPQSTLLEASGLPGYTVISEATDRALLVKLPVTTLDVKNENGRIYSTSIMEGACCRCEENVRSRRLLSAVNDHPDGPFVSPGDASHVVTRVWCEGKYLWNEWEVINTSRGRDLRALIDSKVAFGVSIRGLGSTDDHGNILEDYEYLGTDCVGNPSSKIWAKPEPVSVVKSDTVTNQRESAAPAAVAVSDSGSPTKDKHMSLDKAKTYLSEQITLLANEDNFKHATARMVQVESGLADYVKTLQFADMAELSTKWDTAKTEAFARLSGKDVDQQQLGQMREQLQKSAERATAIVRHYRTEQLRLTNQLARQMREHAKLRRDSIGFRKAATERLTLQQKRLRTVTEMLDYATGKAAHAIKLSAKYKQQAEAAKPAASGSRAAPAAARATPAKPAVSESRRPPAARPVALESRPQAQLSVAPGSGEQSMPDGWV